MPPLGFSAAPALFQSSLPKADGITDGIADSIGEISGDASGVAPGIASFSSGISGDEEGRASGVEDGTDVGETDKASGEEVAAASGEEVAAASGEEETSASILFLFSVSDAYAGKTHVIIRPNASSQAVIRFIRLLLFFCFSEYLSQGTSVLPVISTLIVDSISLQLVFFKRNESLLFTDISSLTGGILEPDDAQSMVRFLLYTNEFDVEGLIATAYGAHGVRPDYIRTLVQTYGEVWENLISHDSAYPSCEALLSLIKSGSAKCGMDELGEGKDTEASDWIIAAADKPDARPLWLLLWGGALDLAQAVWKVKATRTDKEFHAFLAKLRIYAIGDQYDECGPWLKANCPELFYITNYHAFRGMYRGGAEQLTSPEWVKENIYGHGVLSECYPMYQGGDPFGEVKGIKEGDTPSFLYLIPNEIHDPEKPWEANWGGQFQPEENTAECRHFSDAASSPEEAAKTVSCWREDFQADFAGRIRWCVEKS